MLSLSWRVRGVVRLVHTHHTPGLPYRVLPARSSVNTFVDREDLFEKLGEFLLEQVSLAVTYGLWGCAGFSPLEGHVRSSFPVQLEPS